MAVGHAERHPVIVDLRRWRRLPAVAGVLFLVAAVLYIAVRFLAVQLFPVRYGELITREAARHNLDPLLLAAVIRVESSFRPDAVSVVGARGLMQIVPETGAWVAREMPWPGFHPDRLFDPAVNIPMGAWYLAYLRREFGGSLPAALAAYNGGRHNVRRWLDSGGWDGEAETVQAIPFPETRHFVRRVLINHRIYRWLYGERGLFPGLLSRPHPVGVM